MEYNFQDPQNRRDHMQAAADAWDAKRDEWLTTLPQHEQMGAYLAAHALGSASSGGVWLEWDPAQHGTKAEVEAAVTAWVAEQEAAAEVAAAEAAKRTEEQQAADSEREAREAEERADLQARLDAVKAKPTTANTSALVLALAAKLGLA